MSLLLALACAFAIAFGAFWLTVAVVLVRDAWREWKGRRESAELWRKLLR